MSPRTADDQGRTLRARPYGDRAILLAVPIAGIVGVTIATAGLGRAVLLAIGFLVLATGWTAGRFRVGIEPERRRG